MRTEPEPGVEEGTRCLEWWWFDRINDQTDELSGPRWTFACLMQECLSRTLLDCRQSTNQQSLSPHHCPSPLTYFWPTYWWVQLGLHYSKYFAKRYCLSIGLTAMFINRTGIRTGHFFCSSLETLSLTFSLAVKINIIYNSLLQSLDTTLVLITHWYCQNNIQWWER